MRTIVLTGEYQAHSGSVNTSTSPEVQYAYSDPSLGSRQTSLSYPNGRMLNTVYNTGLDSAIGRVSSLADAGGSAAGTDESYSHQGLSTIVGTTDGNGVIKTITLDGFGRSAELKFVNASSVTTDDFQYGYDRAGNVLYKNNLLSSSNSELYHANSTTTGDNNTAYDPLNRLVAFSRGTLSSSGNNGTAPDTVTTAGGTQSWSLDAVGNQSSVTTNGTAVTNSTNSKNELTANGTNALTFDNNGNTTQDQSGQTYTYDAWNRSIGTKNSGGTTIATFAYDVNGHRITEWITGTNNDIYFNTAGQMLQQSVSGVPTQQYVWGLGYVNDLILRDDNSTTGSLGLTSSGLGRRIYGQQDANWNLTSLDSTSGSVLQRAIYSGYGALTVLTPGWATTSDGYSNQIGFQGGYVELATGLEHFGARDYNPMLGRWHEMDPAGYADGLNTYDSLENNPANRRDSQGLDAADQNSLKLIIIPGKPDLGNCGAFDWKIRWDLGPGAVTEDGWIVQEVTYKIDAINCDGTPDKEDSVDHHYWEAWPVKAGGHNAGRVDIVNNGDTWAIGASNPDSNIPRTDRFGSQRRCVKSHGTFNITGTAAFYQGLKLPSTWTVGAPGTNGGPLPVTLEAPTLATPASTAPVSHSVEGHWNCCDTHGNDRKTVIDHIDPEKQQ